VSIPRRVVGFCCELNQAFGGLVVEGKTEVEKRREPVQIVE
jgi:hypothetical protein